MSHFLNSLREKFRLISWQLLAVIMFAIIVLVAPQQLVIGAYKLGLVAIAAVLGYHLDRALFPYASPGSYLQYDWKKYQQLDEPDRPKHPIIPGLERVFATVLIRRAIIVGATILGVTLGL